MDDYWLRDKACIVGIGNSAYSKRGKQRSEGTLKLSLLAIRNAANDAGIELSEIDGMTTFCFDSNTPGSDKVMGNLPIKHCRYTSTVWGGGGSGLPTALADAAMAVATGHANCVAVFRSIVQEDYRMGGAMADLFADGIPPSVAHTIPFGYILPPTIYALRAQRHMALYGTTTEDFARLAIHQRNMAMNNPDAVLRKPMTLEDHQSSRMISDPLRMFDCCQENDGAAAVIVMSAERAGDLDVKPVFIHAIATANVPGWTSASVYSELTSDIGTAGHRVAANELYKRAGLGPEDIDVAELYDGTSAGVLLLLEDWGFCGRGEAGAFVGDGQIDLGGKIPTNTHGGHLSEVYLQGINHLLEAVRQLRGTSHNQVSNAETALYSSGVGWPPGGGILLRR